MPNASSTTAARNHDAHTAHRRHTRHADGNGDSMSVSQKRAIRAIAEQAGVEPAYECRHEFGIELDRLSILEASRLIDHLQILPPAHAGGTADRA